MTSISREDFDQLTKTIADRIDSRLEELVNLKIGKLQGQLEKLEKLDRILSDLRSLFS